MLKTFNLNKPFDLHLDPPSSANPPLCRITQDSKDPIITRDFYLTNMEPREWILPILPTNKEVATSNSAAAACNPPPEIPADPLQPGKICILLKPQFWISEAKRSLQHWIWLALFMSYVYVPQTVINKENLHQMAEGKDGKSTNLNKQLSDSDTSDEEPINPKLKTSIEERQHNTIQGSLLATQAALSHTHTQANPMVEHGPSHTKTIKKLIKD